MRSNLKKKSNHSRISVYGTKGVEEIDVFRQSEGSEQFFAWHGFCLVNKLWDWNSLSSQGEVNLLGLPGHGPVREYPESHYSRWTNSHLIEVGYQSVLKSYRGKPVTLIGFSMGGMIALGVALRAPHIVKRLILLSPLVWGEMGGMVGYWQRYAGNPVLSKLIVNIPFSLSKCSKMIFSQSLRCFVSQPEKIYRNESFSNRLDGAFADYQKTSVRTILGATRVFSETDLRPLVVGSEPTFPTLILHGTKDRTISIEQSRWLSKNLHQSRLVEIPECDHIPYAEEELLVNQKINEFIRTTERPSSWYDNDRLSNVRPSYSSHSTKENTLQPCAV